jgi:hypothetical protein
LIHFYRRYPHNRHKLGARKALANGVRRASRSSNVPHTFLQLIFLVRRHEYSAYHMAAFPIANGCCGLWVYGAIKNRSVLITG